MEKIRHSMQNRVSTHRDIWGSLTSARIFFCIKLSKTIDICYLKRYKPLLLENDSWSTFNTI